MDFATCTIESAFAGQVGLVLHAMSTADQLVNSLKTRTFILIVVGSGSSRRLHATASNNVKTLGCRHADLSLADANARGDLMLQSGNF